MGTKSVLIETNLINGPTLIAVCLGFVHVPNIGLLSCQIIMIKQKSLVRDLDGGGCLQGLIYCHSDLKNTKEWKSDGNTNV